MVACTAADARSFYAAALAGLRFVEARRPTGRRFGAEADARWSGFRGDLTTADRVDLLLRDADAEWPGAFGARTVFAERAVAEDDAFGPAWGSLDPVDAEDLWRRTLALKEPRDLEGVLAAWRVAWEDSLDPFAVGEITTVDRLVLAGPSAVAATLQAFAGRADLAWSEQVTVVATPPAHRQLAALGAAVLNTTKETILFTHGQAHGLLGRAVVSQDAAADDAGAARRSTG